LDAAAVDSRGEMNFARPTNYWIRTNFFIFTILITGGHCFRNTEIVSLRGSRMAEMEIYFVWDWAHEGTVSGFITESLSPLAYR